VKGAGLDMPGKPKRRPGRPTKCTPELIEKFAGYMGDGLYFEDACDLCHVTRRTGYRWLEWGEEAIEEADGNLDCVPEEKRLYAEFCHTVRARAAAAIARNAALVQQRAEDDHPGDWRAAAWFLEHRRPDTWGRREQKTQVTGAGGGPIEVDHASGLIERILADPERSAAAVRFADALRNGDADAADDGSDAD